MKDVEGTAHDPQQVSAPECATSKPADFLGAPWHKEKAIERVILESLKLQGLGGDGTPANWAVDPQVLRFLGSNLRRGMVTLETGAGQTTLVRCRRYISHVHHARYLRARPVKNYCHGVGFETHQLNFIHGNSDIVLPKSERAPDVLDVVLAAGAQINLVPHWYPATASRGLIGAKSLKIWWTH